MNTFFLKQMGIIGLNMIVFSCPALADAWATWPNQI